MALVADYLIISDNLFEISHIESPPPAGGFHHEVSFNVETAAHLASRSILMFVVIVLSGADDIGFEVNINGSTQLAYTFATGNRFHSLHEVINANVLRHGANTIEFHPTGGSGKLQFGDVVLFYQRSI